MRLSKSLLRSAILLAAVVAAGCDRDVDSVTAPATVPSGPNALIVTTGYSDVSVGANFACAVRAVDGGLVCWGDGEYGKTTPPTVGKYSQVSAGTQHACALRTDYVVVCWGNRDWGESSPPAYTFSQVSAGNRYTCGVRMDNRSLACWGYNPSAVANMPSVAFTQVTAGDVHTCGLTFSDKRVLCWGSSGAAPVDAYTQVDVGADYTCAVRSAGTLACWGKNLYGQSSVPSGTYTQVAAAYTHTCAIRASDRGILCWGQDRVGMLNAPAGAYTKVSAGSSNACAIRAADLTLVCWGNTSYGMSSPPGISTAHTPPSATFSAGLVVALDTFLLNLSSARVDGYPQATSFTYQFDCGDGKGYGAAQPASYTRCPTRVAGTRIVRGKVIDQDGDTASYKITLPVKLRPDTVTFTSTAPISPVIKTTYTVSAQAKSGLPVTFSTTTPSACSVSGNVITFSDITTCAIVADSKGDSTWARALRSQGTKPIWPFTGFFTTVQNLPQWNAMPAGRYVKLIFALDGNRSASGTVVPSGTASTQVIACDSNAIPYIVTTSTTVGPATLEYSWATARYTLTWKTDLAWKGSCRSVRVTLRDGTMHTLRFKFT